MVEIADRHVLRGSVQTRGRLFVASALAGNRQDSRRELLGQPKPVLVMKFGGREGLFPDRRLADERFPVPIVVHQIPDFAGDITDGWVAASFSHRTLLGSRRGTDSSARQPGTVSGGSELSA